MAGLTPEGFEIPTVSDIVAEMATALRSAYGPETDTSAESVLGQLIGIFAERERSVWEAARDVWQAFTPGGATGQSLTQIALLTGTVRRAATKSRVVASVTLNGGVTLPAGSRARAVGDETAVFETLADKTNPGGSPATFTDVVMDAVDPGPVRANAGTLTVIVTPVSGWTAVTNALDAEMGLPDETDTELRLRREQELRVQGSSSVDAIEQDLKQVDGVIDARVFENVTDVTDGDGIPPHAFHAVMWDGDTPAAENDAIAQAIWDSKPAGILAAGFESGSAIDAQGDTQTVFFDRADENEIYLEFDIDTDATTFPADGVDRVIEAVVAYADARWTIGEDVILAALYASVFSVSGVTNITEVRAGFAPSPVGTSDLTIDPTDIARADTGRILVNGVAFGA